VIKAIIFDFDGVLVESAHIKTEAFRKLFSHRPDKSDEIVEYHLRNAGISRYVKFKNIYENILHEPYSEETGVKLGKELSMIVIDEIKKAAFVRGAEDFLGIFYHEYSFFIASGTPQDELNEIVRHKKIDKYFKGIFGTPATKTQIINYILTENRWEKGDVVFVGDAESDLRAAEESGIHFILRRTEENNDILNSHTVRDLTYLNNKIIALQINEV